MQPYRCLGVALVFDTCDAFAFLALPALYSVQIYCVITCHKAALSACKAQIFLVDVTAVVDLHRVTVMGAVPVIAVAVTLPMLMIGVIVLTAAQHAGACLVPPATTLVGVVPEVNLALAAHFCAMPK